MSQGFEILFNLKCSDWQIKYIHPETFFSCDILTIISLMLWQTDFFCKTQPSLSRNHLSGILLNKLTYDMIKGVKEFIGMIKD